MNPQHARRRGLAEKQQECLDEILVGAARAFGRRGYAATSIDDVAEELGCTKGRVYHYVRSKGELYFAIHRMALKWALEAVVPVWERTDLTPTDKLHGMVVAHAMHMMKHVEFIGPSQHHAEENLAREGRIRDADTKEVFAMRRKFEDCFVDVIRQGVKAKEFRKVDPVLTTKIILGPANWMNVWFRADGPFDTKKARDKIADEIAYLVVNGLKAS